MKTNTVTSNRLLANVLAIAMTAGGISSSMPASAHDNDRDREFHAVKHVLLISVDGLHQTDLEWFVATHPNSTLARLVDGGISYTHARTPFPSDSFPGLIAQVTGGNPKSTGVYYDDAYSRALLPAGTTECTHATPGAEIAYFENLDLNLDRLDAGQGIVGLYANFSLIYGMTGKPQNLIDQTQLPVDPTTCLAVFPHQYLRTNTIFEVIHAHGLRTAWSDKHPAYEILNGPSGKGVDDLFAPEINSSTTDPSLPAGVSPDFTKDNTSTQLYDALKVKAVINWINGHDHAGNGSYAMPAILGLNFQSVSTAQKLNTSNYYVEPSNPSTLIKNGLGGYTNSGTVPGLVLHSALRFVDEQLATLVKALGSSDTVLVLSAKHGQSPLNRADLSIIDDGAMITALNTAWDPSYASDGKLPLIAHAMDDDGVLLWLNDRSTTAIKFVKNFLENYAGNAVGSDANGQSTIKPFISAGLAKIYAGREAAEFMGVKHDDSRVPDLIGIAQPGVVWAGGKLSKIAEHGGDAVADRHVPIVVWGAGIEQHRVIDKRVDTAQIAPSILKLLGIEPTELQAVQLEGTEVLPQLRGDN